MTDKNVLFDPKDFYPFGLIFARTQKHFNKHNFSLARRASPNDGIRKPTWSFLIEEKNLINMQD